MDQPMTEEEKYKVARSRVEAIKGFYIHAIVFVAVMTGLALADFSRGESWWVQWPLIGWGIGLLAHAYMVFGTGKLGTREWEERKIKEIVSKM
jgi:fatty acid desaturase